MLTKQEQAILECISIASHNDPHRPEFPFDDPKFPATSTYQINVPGFSNVWLKDESHNPTGTHKDRMAREIVVTYKDFLQAKKYGLTSGPLPQMSLISSGTAAFAIQFALRKFDLPALKVLLDHHIDTSIESTLIRLGCETYHTDLSKKELKPREILKLTHNESGIDITSSTALDASTRFYDWMSYEIINESPQRCFIPFGTGNLYENILNVAKHEISQHSGGSDPRYTGNSDELRGCHFIGATTNNPKSSATKLYSPHLPFMHFDDQWLKFYIYAGFCGKHSNVLPLKEVFLEQAINILKKQDITIEPSGAAGLALLLQMKDTVPKNDKILIVSTGKTKFDLE